LALCLGLLLLSSRGPSPESGFDLLKVQTAEQQGDSGFKRVAVAALGRLEPSGEVIDVGSPEEDVIERLVVKEGQQVEAGAALAYLNGHSVRLAEKSLAESQLGEAKAELEAERVYGEALIKEAEARIEQLKAVPPLEIEAQDVKLKQLQAQLESETAHGTALIKEAELRIRRSEEISPIEIEEQTKRIKELEAELKAETSLGESRIKEAELRKRQLESLPPLDTKAQEAKVRQFEAELANSTSDYNRLKGLAADRTVTQQECDRQEMLVHRDTEKLNQSKAVLEKLKKAQGIDMSVAVAELESAKAELPKARSQILVELECARPGLTRMKKAAVTDLLLARAQLESAKTNLGLVQKEVQVDLSTAKPVLEKLKKAQEQALALAAAQVATAKANLARSLTAIRVQSLAQELELASARLERTIIRAPAKGEILKILARPGEQAGDGPVLKMGDTSQMYVVAEVHETDVRFVRTGQLAKVASPALAEPLEGVVEHVGRIIFKNDVLDVDPAADTDARVVEVRIRLKDSDPASGLTNLQVDVVIDLRSPEPTEAPTSQNRPRPTRHSRVGRTHS